MKITTKTHANRWIIGDIHGCSKTLRSLVETQICLTKSDQLFFIGDYIDRGPDSSGVLDYILTLINDGFQIFPLRGNHEENVLKALAEYDVPTFAHFVGKINKSRDLLDENLAIKQAYKSFFEMLPYYHELDDFYLVHAGFDFTKQFPFEDTDGMLNYRFESKKFDISGLNGKRMIHGHQATEIQIIRKAVEQKSQIIPIDNGCVYRKAHKIYDHTRLGKLCALNLDTFQLIEQENIDM